MLFRSFLCQMHRSPLSHKKSFHPPSLYKLTMRRKDRSVLSMELCGTSETSKEEDTSSVWEPASPGVASMSLERNGQNAWIHVPESLMQSRGSDNVVEGTTSQERLYPLLVVLHGAGKGSTMWNLQEQVAMFADIANQFDMVVLYPEARGSTWDYIRSSKGEDTEFLEHAINTTRQTFPIDDARIAVKGISDGGSMALCLATYNPTIFQAVLSVSAGFCTLHNDDKNNKMRDIGRGMKAPIEPQRPK